MSLGWCSALLPIIPFICNFSFFALIVLSAPIILVYMKKLDMIGILDIRQGAMYGAIIGFISFVAFSVSFVPLATIIGFIYKGSYYLGVSLLFRTGFFVLIMMVFFVALLAALMNAFHGLLQSMFTTSLNKNLKNQRQTLISRNRRNGF